MLPTSKVSKLRRWLFAPRFPPSSSSLSQVQKEKYRIFYADYAIKNKRDTMEDFRKTYLNFSPEHFKVIPVKEDQLPSGYLSPLIQPLIPLFPFLSVPSVKYIFGDRSCSLPLASFFVSFIIVHYPHLSSLLFFRPSLLVLPYPFFLISVLTPRRLPHHARIRLLFLHFRWSLRLHLR